MEIFFVIFSNTQSICIVLDPDCDLLSLWIRTVNGHGHGHGQCVSILYEPKQGYIVHFDHSPFEINFPIAPFRRMELRSEAFRVYNPFFVQFSIFFSPINLHFFTFFHQRPYHSHHDSILHNKYPCRGVV